MRRPSADWFQPGFDDSAWSRGAAPFGAPEPAIGRNPDTPWKSPDIWLRRSVELPSGKSGEPVLLLHHDEDAEVYLNGVPAASVTGYNAAYARSTWRPRHGPRCGRDGMRSRYTATRRPADSTSTWASWRTMRNAPAPFGRACWIDLAVPHSGSWTEGMTPEDESTYRHVRQRRETWRSAEETNIAAYVRSVLHSH